MRINELILSIIKHHLIIDHLCISLTDARRTIDNDDGLHVASYPGQLKVAKFEQTVVPFVE